MSASVMAVGEGPWSAPVRFTTESAPPDAPTHLVVQGVGARWLRLDWQAADANGGKMVQYELRLVNLALPSVPPRQVRKFCSLAVILTTLRAPLAMLPSATP